MRPVLVLCMIAVAGLGLGGCNRKNDETAPKAAAAGQAAAPAVASAPAAVSAPPRRKPGLWRQTVSTAGMTQSSRICLDEAAEQKLSAFGEQATRGMCEKNEVSRRPDGTYAFTSVCDMGQGGKTTTTGVASGDFDVRYKVEAESTTTAASAPQMNGAHKMTLEAEWLGPCPAGFKPGDIELPGGMKINALQMAPKG